MFTHDVTIDVLIRWHTGTTSIITVQSIIESKKELSMAFACNAAKLKAFEQIQSILGSMGQSARTGGKNPPVIVSQTCVDMDVY